MLNLFRRIFLLFLFISLSSCFYWARAYQTYLQMDDFDQNFAITVDDEFNLHFKQPVLYSEDFVSLAKLYPSRVFTQGSGKRWRYWFRKLDEQGRVILPEIKFYFDLNFNTEDRLTKWSFSPLFLQIAPAEFLEISIRSVATSKINHEKRQLRANTDLVNKISSELPKKPQVLNQLGEPLMIIDEGIQETYLYHFLLDVREIKQGYEDRALSEIKLSFDKQTEELVKMSGRFAGLKISIDYKKYQKGESGHQAQLYLSD